MAKIPKKLLSVQSLLAHVLVIPAFLLFFVLIYSPRWIVDMLEIGQFGHTFNLVMVMCIVLGVLCASRIPVTSVQPSICILNPSSSLTRSYSSAIRIA